MSKQKSANKTSENSWTKYVPPSKKKNRVKKKENVDLFNPDMFPTLNNDVENKNNIHQDNKTFNFKDLFNDDIVNDREEEDDTNKDMLTLTKENIEQYKEDKNRVQEEQEEYDLEQLNDRATKCVTEILNRENEKKVMLSDLYGPGYFEEYVLEDLPYYSSTDEEEDNNSISSFDDEDEYYDDYF